MTITLHEGDIPADFSCGDALALDTETTGLNPRRDHICLMQLSSGDGHAHVIRFSGRDYAAPNLRKLLSDERLTKIIHFARFDAAMIEQHFGITLRPIFCTMLASRFARTYAQGHLLSDVCRDMLGIDLTSRAPQRSDWSAPDLSPAQLEYAASDVLYLHELRKKLTTLLQREDRLRLAQECFAFLPTRASLDRFGWSCDILDHV